MAFKKAKREQIYIKALLAGPSGSGKSYSALRLATGIAKKSGGRIAVIDTENGRINYYADEFDYDVMTLPKGKWSPEDYINAIGEASSDADYTVLVIDSITNEWETCLDIHNKMPGNSYTNWAKITPRHDAFVKSMLDAPIHIIATVRGKDEYVLTDKNGKQVPQKVGLGYKQRDGLEYEYTVTFNLSQDTHVADATKDNTHIFEGRYEKLTELDGEKLYDWANTGDKPAPKPIEEPKAPEVDLAELKKNIIKLCSELGGTKNEALMNRLKQTVASGNPNAIKSADKAVELFNDLTAMKGDK